MSHWYNVLRTHLFFSSRAPDELLREYSQLRHMNIEVTEAGTDVTPPPQTQRHLFAFQEAAGRHIFAKESVLVCAPTGMGKTGSLQALSALP